MTLSPRILIGGVPFGCHNIGDEAILACGVQIVREVSPGARITVSTGEPERTSRWLSVDTCQLFGFSEEPDTEAFRDAIRTQDVYIWCGATGLSDYPEEAVELLRVAQRLGKKTVLWGVGMNSRLNPAKYEVQPGRRLATLNFLTGLSLGRVSFVNLEERRRQNRACKKIATYLNQSDLIVVRDHESCEILRRTGVSNEIVIGSDSAILVEPKDLTTIELTDDLRKLLESTRKKVGLCISTSAPKFADIPGLASFLVRLIDSADCDIVFLPMDPVVDAALLRELQPRINRSDRTHLLEGFDDPSVVTGILATLDAVISSRLHMLILAANVHVPMIGISPGSKMDNFMRLYDLSPAGTAELCDFDRLTSETIRMLERTDEFRDKSQRVRSELLARLEKAKAKLREVLSD